MFRELWTIVEASRTRTVLNGLQYCGVEDLEREIVEAGFAVDELLGDVAGSPLDPEGNVIAVVARPS
jgi:hypothetical protein